MAVSSVRTPFFRQCAHSALSPLHFTAPISSPLCTVSRRCIPSSCGMAQWFIPAAISPMRALLFSLGTPSSMAACLPPGLNTLGSSHFSARRIAFTCAAPAPRSGIILLAVAVSFCRHPTVRVSAPARDPRGASTVCGSSASSAAATLAAVSSPCSVTGLGSFVVTEHASLPCLSAGRLPVTSVLCRRPVCGCSA